MKRMQKIVVPIVWVTCLCWWASNVQADELRSCGGASAKTLNKKAELYKNEIQHASKRYGVSQALIKSIISSESCFREMVVSCKGASGLMQLMPGTAANFGALDVFDPAENIDAGTRYLSYLLRRYNGSLTHVIAAYNAGEGRIEPGAPVTISFKETRGYINNVLTAMTKLETGGAGLAEAQLLLADWQQTEREYQAALRGETLQPPTVILTSLETQQGMAAPGNVPGLLVAPEAQITRSGRVTVAMPATTEQGVQDAALVGMNTGTVPMPAGNRRGTVTFLPKQPTDNAQQMALAQNTIPMPAGNVPNDVVVVTEHTGKRGKRSTPAPQPLPEQVPVPTPNATDELIPQGEVVQVTEVQQTAEQPLQEPAALPAATGLLACADLPPEFLQLTEQGGSGRYAAFFYKLKAGETLETIANTLGVNMQDILYLNSLQPDTPVRPGRKLKVAECQR